MEYQEKEFGTLKSGEEVKEYTLINNKISVSFLNYGGVITKIMTPDKRGKMENIVAGFNNIGDYENKSPYFGAFVGRTAGRIANGKFTINNKEYQLDINNGINNLHGGAIGLSHKIWNVKQIENGYRLSYLSPHNEHGFPGEVYITFEYVLIGNTFTINYQAKVSEDTILNFTNHTYFNLSGNCKTNILNHDLKIDSNAIAELNQDLIPDGTKMSVIDTPFDFRKTKRIGKEINETHQQLQYGNGYDHPWYLNHNQDDDVVLSDPTSGRVLKVKTDQRCVVVYTGNFLGEEGMLNCDAQSCKNIAIALETQNVPNYMNIKNNETKFYSPTNPYQAFSKWTFEVK